MVTIQGSGGDKQDQTGCSVRTSMMAMERTKGTGEDGNGMSENYFTSHLIPGILHYIGTFRSV